MRLETLGENINSTVTNIMPEFMITQSVFTHVTTDFTIYTKHMVALDKQMLQLEERMTKRFCFFVD